MAEPENLYAQIKPDEEEDKIFPILNERNKQSHIDLTPMVRHFSGIPWIGLFAAY